ncbi:Gfo/Idh/MocA family protein [Actinospica robiniae]|uniref:Gfo/Idh/MocA family protein n=1 Tax=Actinospica robiniae TaxID=304901 RepID=UPI0003FEFEE6|nr:Gfo/Idh/MocA family oxidoreductase [Actinospica robiniae]
MGEPLNVGVIGAGNISGAYLRTLETLPLLRVAAIADRDPRRAAAAVAQVPGARAATPEDILGDSDIDIVLNLTPPAAHAQIALAAIAAGKHVYGEKPLAASRSEAAEICDAAVKARLRVGCAPDTVLGTGIQTARASIEQGLIGTPTSAIAVFTCFGHERWHPDPEFYYQPGGGPLLDMGPYYLSALVHMLGPVRSITGAASRPRPERTIASGPRAGTTFPSSIDTHVTAVLEHESGALTTLVMSFDVLASRASNIEVHGTGGSLVVPDPNHFDGEVLLASPGVSGWQALPPSAGYVEAARGYGLAEMAQSIGEDRAHRCSADLAYHVLDCAHTLLQASQEHTTLDVTSRCDVPPLVPLSG